MPQETTVQPTAAPDATQATTPAAEGQGGTDLTSGLFNLDTVPEAIRDQVAPLIKEWDGNVTREFQKRAEATKAWEPYDQLGIRDVSPEDLGHLLSFYDIASDEEKFKGWVQDTYGKLGLGEAPESDAGGEGAADEPPQYLTPEQAEEMWQQREQEREQQEETQRLHDEIAHEARTTLDELLGGLGDVSAEDKEQVEDLVCFLANRHQDGTKSVADALKAGFADYQRQIGKAQSDALDEKLQQPKPAETGGKPHSPPQEAQSFDDAKARLKERLRAASAQ